MKFFEGELQNAISKRKTFSSVFMVFVESKDEESTKFRKYLDEETAIPAKEYVAFRVSPPSQSYKYFLELYRHVPVPSLFIIGSDGQPINIVTTCEPRDQFYAAIKQALEVHKADLLNQRQNDRIRNLVQILLKLPRGETAVVEFLGSSRLGEVKTFVQESLQVKNPFLMIIPFPRKVFSPEDEGKTLFELELYPTSTILVVPTEKRKSWTPELVSNIWCAIVAGVGSMYRTLRNWLSSFLPRITF